MTTIQIAPPIVNECDILEYAKALIEEHGWRQGPRVPDNEEWDEVAKNGLSLHDAIGMACWRLSGETATATSPARSYSHSKDFPTGSRASAYGYSSSLRTAATEIVVHHVGSATNDIDFNDKASDANKVLAVLDAAIQEACDEQSRRVSRH